MRKESIRAFLWDLAGRFANQGVGFIVSVFLARLLMPEDFGTIAMVTVVISVASVFVDVGLSGALIQRKRILPVHYNSVFYFNLFIAVLLSVLLFFSAPYVEQFYQYEGLTLYVRGLSPLFVLNALNSVQLTRLRRKMQFDKVTKVGVSTGIISGICGVSLAFAGFGIWSLIIQQLMQAAISVVLLWTAAGWRPDFQFSFKALKQLWGFGFNMFLSGFLDTIFTRLDVIIIGKMFTASALGFYNRGKGLNSLVTTYTAGSLMQVTYPLLSKLQYEKERFAAVVHKVLSLVSFGAFFLGGLLFTVGEEVILIVYSAKWLAAVPFFKILILNSYSQPVNSVLVNILKGKGNSKAFLKLEVIKKSIYFVNILIGFSFGIEGFLYGLIIVTLINTQINIFFANKDMAESQWWYTKIIYSNGVIAAISISVSLLLKGYIASYSPFTDLILFGSIYSLVYFMLSFLAGTQGMLVAKGELQKVSFKRLSRKTV